MSKKENRFSNFAFLCMEFVRDMNSMYTQIYTRSKIKINDQLLGDRTLRFLGYKKLSNDSNANYIFKPVYDAYNNFKVPNNCTDLKDTIIYINEFAIYIRDIAEKCFMYNNSEENDIYVEQTNDKITSIFFIFDNHKIKITFETTDIVSPDVNSNPLANYINEEDIPSIKLINIEIVRNFGKQMKNRFSFILGESPKYNNKSDEILLEVTIKEIRRAIMEKYCHTLNLIQPIYTGVSTVDWKDAIEDGLWIRKYNAK